MARVFIDLRSAYMASLDSRARLSASGHELVRVPEAADWAIVHHQDDLDGILGVVPEVVLHTPRPYAARAWPLDAIVDGSRVRTLSPWTVGLETAWRHWVDQGPREFVDPRERRRSGTSLLASVKQSRHGVIAEDLTQVWYDLGARGYERGLVDVIGLGWESTGVTPSRRGSAALASASRQAALQRYSVNIALESVHVRGFVTERLWESIRAGTLPVYYGSAWLDELIPRGAYVDLRDYDGPDAVLDFVARLRRREIVDRVRSLQDSLRALEASIVDEEPVHARWSNDVVSYIDYRIDTSRRAQTSLGTGSPSILDYRAKELDRLVAGVDRTTVATSPSQRKPTAPGERTVHLSPETPYLKGEDRVAVWRERGFTVVDSPADAQWAVAYHQRELPELVGQVPRILFHTYEPLFTSSLPFYSQVGGSEVFSFGVWTGGVEDTWRYWLRFGPKQYLDPSEGERSRTVILASTKARAHDKFAEDLTGLRHRIAVEGQARGLVDIYGRDWGDVPTMGESRMATGGFSAAKHAILGTYAFNLCLENNHVPGFVTEKPWQAIRGGCLPIYFGSSWMDRLFPSMDYIDLRKVRSIDHLYEYMQSLSADEIVERVRRLQTQLRELEQTAEGTMRSQGLKWLHDIASFIDAVNDDDLRAVTRWGIARPSAREYSLAGQRGEPLPPPRPLPIVGVPRRRFGLLRR